MAVETTNAYSGPYSANGVTTSFPFTFSAMSADDVTVILRSAAGDDTTVSPSAYSVALTGAAPSAGTVTFTAAPASGNGVLILLDLDFTQETQFENGSPWLASPVNNANDRAALRDQALKRDVDRAIKLPVGEDGITFPALAARAGKFIAFDGAGVMVPASGTGADAGLREDLAEAPGAALVGYSHSASYAFGSTGYELQNSPRVVNSVAALRLNSSTGFRKNVMTLGYWLPGDMGGGSFAYDSADTTSADNGGTIIVDAAGRRWKRHLPDGSLNPQMFGAKADLVANDTAAVQAMFAAADKPSGNHIKLIGGECIVNDTIVIANPVTVEGVGGQVQTSGAYAGFVSVHATKAIFNITHSQANTFRNFGIRAGITRTGGSDFTITGDGVNQPIGTVFDNVQFNGSFNAISIPNGKHWSVINCVFVNMGYGGFGNCIYFPSNANPDSGDNIISGNSFISGVSGTTNYGYAAVYLESTFALQISDNKFFGFQYGIAVNAKDGSGNLLLANNSFENQALSWIDVRQADASSGIGNIVIDGNELSQLDTVTPPVTPTAPGIFIQQGLSGAYVSKVVISNNVVNNKYAANFSAIAVNDGAGVLIMGNVFDLNSEALPGSIQIGGNATGARVLDNVFINQTTAQHYKNGLNASTVVRDDNLAFVDLGGWANGSEVYVTNGTAGSPLTGAGSGSKAFRINGAWKGI